MPPRFRHNGRIRCLLLKNRIAVSVLQIDRIIIVKDFDRPAVRLDFINNCCRNTVNALYAPEINTLRLPAGKICRIRLDCFQHLIDRMERFHVADPVIIVG